MRTYTNFLQRCAFQPRRHSSTQTALMVLDPALADLALPVRDTDPALADLALPVRDTDSAILTYGYSWLL